MNIFMKLHNHILIYSITHTSYQKLPSYEDKPCFIWFSNSFDFDSKCLVIENYKHICSWNKWDYTPVLGVYAAAILFSKNKSIPQFQHHFSKVWFYNMTEHLNFFHQHQLNLSHSLLNVYFWHNTLHYFCRCNLYVIALSMLC